MRHLLSKRIGTLEEDVKGKLIYGLTCGDQRRYGCQGCFGNCARSCTSFCG